MGPGGTGGPDHLERHVQWLPDPPAVVARIREHVAPLGTLAFQVPNNFDAPSHLSCMRFRHETPTHFTTDLHLPRGIDAIAYPDLLSSPDG